MTLLRLQAATTALHPSAVTCIRIGRGMNVERQFMAGKNAKCPWNMIKNRVKNVIFFTNVQIFLEEKDQNIQSKL